MNTYRKILVAIDGSENSFHALKESFKMVACEKCWVSAVSVIPHYKGDLELTVFGDVLESLSLPYKNALQKASDIAKENNVILKTYLEEGEPHEKIVDLADGENFDLILIGRKGASNIERLLMGSVTARVIGYSNKDILVIPENSSISWKKILVCFDGSKYSLNALKKAIDIANFHKSEISIVSVFDIPVDAIADSPHLYESSLQKIDSKIKEASKLCLEKDIEPKIAVLEGNPAKEIVNYQTQNDISVIVMGSHGKTGLRRLLMGSVTENVINLANCPVLVVKS